MLFRGIANNFQSNCVMADSDWVVVEADEFDRSFLTLSPKMAAITAVDPDHLDIYGTEESFYQDFSSLRKNTIGRCVNSQGRYSFGLEKFE